MGILSVSVKDFKPTNIILLELRCCACQFNFTLYKWLMRLHLNWLTRNLYYSVVALSGETISTIVKWQTQTNKYIYIYILLHGKKYGRKNGAGHWVVYWFCSIRICVRSPGDLIRLLMQFKLLTGHPWFDIGNLSITIWWNSRRKYWCNWSTNMGY